MTTTLYETTGERLLSTTTVSLAADAATTLFTVPAGQRLVLTKAILVVGADAVSTDIQIGITGEAGNFIPTTQCDNLNAANDAALLQPIAHLTTPMIDSYAPGAAILFTVANQAGGASNTVFLFGFLYNA